MTNTTPTTHSPTATDVEGQFATFRAANLARCNSAFFPLDHWSPMQWGCALGGEAGEALNVLKKIERDGPTPERVEAVASELSDIITYADLTAARLGIELWPALVRTFNNVSERVGSKIKLAALAVAPQAATVEREGWCPPERLVLAANEVAATSWRLDSAIYRMGRDLSDAILVTPAASLTLGDLRLHLKSIRKLGETIAAAPTAPTAPEHGVGDEPHLGWFFHNPDTGHEWSENHPVESGEVDDATDIIPATLEVMREHMLAAWDAAEELRPELDAARLPNPAPGIAARLGEPHCWVIPGSDTANDYGHIDACCFENGEMSRPLWTLEAIKAALIATPTRPVEDGALDDGTLDARLKAAGMLTVAEMMGTTPMTRWTVHSGMTDLDFFERWLDRRYAEMVRMSVAYELGDKDKSDELYEWVIAHRGVLSEVRDNFRAARSGDPTPSNTTEQALRGAAEVEAKARRAVECLAATPMSLSLNKWNELSNAILTALDAPAAISADPAQTGDR